MDLEKIIKKTGVKVDNLIYEELTGIVYLKIQEIIKTPNNIKIIHILGLYIVISNTYNMYQTRIQNENNKSTCRNFIL